MKAANQKTVFAFVSLAVWFAYVPLANAADVATLAATQPAACGTLGYTRMQDLRLAAKAQEGVGAFVKYFRQHKLIQQWSLEEAVARAHAASVTSCAVAIGLKPIDQTKFATALAANSR